LKRHYPTTCEAHNLGRIRNTRRNVGIVEWIVEGIAKKYECTAAVTMMAAYKGEAGKAETVTTTIAIWTVWISVTVRGRRVIYINPSFSGAAAHTTHNFPIGRPPG